MYKAFLSLRYLRTRYIAMASIVSVMLGVATMIVVNSVMKGFTSEMRGRIQGLLSDIVIETNSLDGQRDAQEQFERARKVCGDKIAGMTATVEVWGLVTFNFGGQWTTRPITLIGIQPEQKASVGPLVQYLESYHTLKDGKKIIRQPLRAPDEPPSWELTAQAKAFRHEANQRRKWIEEKLDNPREASGEGDGFHSHVSQVNHSQPSKPASPPNANVAAAGTKTSPPSAAAQDKNPFQDGPQIPTTTTPPPAPINDDDPNP